MFQTVSKSVIPTRRQKSPSARLSPALPSKNLPTGSDSFPPKPLSCKATDTAIPPCGEGFIRAVQDFTQQGKLLLNISQVPQGCAAAVYAQGDALRRAGVVNGGKCNLETATALMTLAVSEGWGADGAKHELQRLGLV